MNLHILRVGCFEPQAAYLNKKDAKSAGKALVDDVNEDLVWDEDDYAIETYKYDGDVKRGDIITVSACAEHGDLVIGDMEGDYVTTFEIEVR